ncbi:MAG: tryptophan synthase subunit alpha [Chitinophagales bacterium]|nr:tryptophan synthase subunit alpha [Chitinophagales bacterium]MCZ2393331.1 tryptophan synthase subunit alpha [Chitinophagales bacterium]
MNRIQKLFLDKKENVLSIFITAGFPYLDSLPQILIALEAAGVDMVEIGIPFSDPTADGPAIQHSNNVAIKNGMTIPYLFSQLKDIRKKVSIPLVLMGYLNPPMQYGFDRFIDDAVACGIDGIILPDLPMEEYLDSYQEKFKSKNLSNIFLITPQTSEQRIQWIDKESEGFIYVVSTNTITGGKVDFEDNQKDYFSKVRNLQLKNPALVGFGIRDKSTFNIAAKYLQGAIIGTAFIKHIEAHSNRIEEAVKEFIETFN